MGSCHILGLLDLTPEGTRQLELSATAGEEVRDGEWIELLTGLSALQRTIETLFFHTLILQLKEMNPVEKSVVPDCSCTSK